MKVVLALALAAVLIGVASPASAATTKFTSCDQMHRVYPQGISKSKAAANRAVQNGQARPKVAPKVYADSYKTLDRDRDGSMCEVPA
jgi:hypothetical protein